MTWKNLKIAAIWCRQHWRWMVLSLAFIVVYYLGRRDLRSLKIQAELAKKQYTREKEAIEKAYKHEMKKRQEADQRYVDAVNKIEARYEKDKHNISHAKKEQIKAMVRKAKDNPQAIDQILEQQLGIKKQ